MLHKSVEYWKEEYGKYGRKHVGMLTNILTIPLYLSATMCSFGSHLHVKLLAAVTRLRQPIYAEKQIVAKCSSSRMSRSVSRAPWTLSAKASLFSTLFLGQEGVGSAAMLVIILLTYEL